MDRAILSLNDKFSVRIISQLNELSNLKEEWDKLAFNEGSYVPFLCFDWFSLWLKHFLNDDQLLVLLFYKYDDLEAIAPLLIKQQRFNGIPVRKVELIGNVYSPIQTFIFRDMDNPQGKEECISFIFKYFFQINKNWDVIDLQAIPEENTIFQNLSDTIAKDGFKGKEYFCFGNWYSDGILYSSERYFFSRSRNLRASIKKNFKRGNQAGKLRFKMITGDKEVSKYMKTYFDVYSKTWKKRERVGPDFYLDLTKIAAQKGWLRLGFVFLDDIPIACGFAIVHNRYAYFEKTGYDDRYKKLGAGSIWLTEMMKYVIDVDGVKVIDLLRGDDEYKKRWVAKRRERKGILFFNKNLKGRLLALLINKIQPMIKRYRYFHKTKEIIKNCLLFKSQN